MVNPNPKIAPSMLSSDFANLAAEADRMLRYGADWLHMDIMSLCAKPTIGAGAPVIESLRKHTQKNWQELIHRIKSKGMRPGVALKPETPIEEVYPLLEAKDPVEMVLVMTAQPGFGGQKFMPDMMDKVRDLRKKYPSLDIEVDGGLGPSTVDLASSAGANCIVAGSSVFGASYPAQVISQLRKSVQDAEAGSKNCDTTSSLDYVCGGNKSQQKCKTFALLRANPRYSSLSNLSSYLGISHSGLAEANEFSGESFYEISESLEGLTTCKAIQEKNPTTDDLSKFLLSYPVREGDKLSDLAVKFNASQENIVAANSRYSRTGLFKPDNSLLPLSTLLIPLQAKPVLGLSAKSQEPNLGYPAASIKVRGSHKRRKPKMWMIGVYIAIGIVGLLACLAIGAAFFFIHCKRKKEDPIKNGDSELQQLSLSIRTTSDKKVSFEGSQYNFDDPITATTTPHKVRDEYYTFEELQKATEDFSLSNLIEGSVFHGRLKGKTLAIKRVPSDVISKIDYEILQERIHRHPNTIRLLGTCLTDSPDSYIVLEYAKNGSLKDWIHSGLAIKSQFIASCNCFLTWNQRVKICLDVAKPYSTCTTS
ncbi:UNVERIFIED_CONTAM: protein LYK2 [Sesamum angustifolium]|uniref:ribulose-phosphate 3-epimerase n=1 Tax=Sesamum angustifolium TaxID=2727405 RepID=A0AAW2RP28_9LAMI